ncbi:hemerythrin domain-containing protein [Vibrio sp. Of7-15]|uniref:hemerythrin domain-containing protein n=1 Tax=Vibrio sp. Of7-15 TaxID=2724879 RepID=UPI001EF38D06|nr:hemerythrin domain-containing protein [Vibrio sp. Of7-15]MCG7497606.1 hemerythrin domain-containing protein [Vibrio sp. Of7-15]
MLLESIHREHGYMNRLIAVLEQKLQLLQDEKPINYTIVKEVVDYLQEFSEQNHHPKEDLIYQYYVDHFNDVSAIENLVEEHHSLAKVTAGFSEVVEMILNDAVIPQHLFIVKLEAFIERVKGHLELENQQILPLLQKNLNEKDWQYLEAQWCEQSDPIFGEVVAGKYRHLAARLNVAEKEAV